MRKKLFWSVFVIATFWLLLQASSAFADCPSGRCSVIINTATGETTYQDAPPPIQITGPLSSQTIEPTHTISVQTTAGSWGTSGTVEQIAEAVQNLKPKPLSFNPCSFDCNRIEIDATNGTITTIPLSEKEIKQTLVSQVNENKNKAELAKTAYQALPNITAWQPINSFNTEPLPTTLLDETLTPDWWASWVESLNLFFENWFWWWSL